MLRNGSNVTNYSLIGLDWASVIQKIRKEYFNRLILKVTCITNIKYILTVFSSVSI